MKPLPWDDNLFDAVAAITGDRPTPNAWCLTCTGYDLGFAAVLAIIRQAPSPVSLRVLDRALTTTLSPDIVAFWLPPVLLPKWRRATERHTRIQEAKIPWTQVVRNALNCEVLAMTPSGLVTLSPQGLFEAGPKLKPETEILDSPALVTWALFAHLDRLESR